MDDRRVPHWEYQVTHGAVSAGNVLIVLITFSLGMAGGCPTPAAAAVAESSGDAKPDAESKEGERRPLQSLLQGATPEEHAQLEEERKRISAAAKAFGSDPTAIVGYYELTYGNSSFTNILRLNTMAAEARLPITPN